MIYFYYVQRDIKYCNNVAALTRLLRFESLNTQITRQLHNWNHSLFSSNILFRSKTKRLHRCDNWNQNQKLKLWDQQMRLVPDVGKCVFFLFLKLLYLFMRYQSFKGWGTTRDANASKKSSIQDKAECVLQEELQSGMLNISQSQLNLHWSMARISHQDKNQQWLHQSRTLRGITREEREFTKYFRPVFLLTA